MKKLMVVIVVLPLLLTSASSAMAGKIKSTFNVSVTVIETGSVRSTDITDFSNYNSINPADNKTAQGDGIFRCANKKCSKSYITRSNTMTTKQNALPGSNSETLPFYIYTVEY